MMTAILAALAFVSVLLFPWPLAAFLAVAASLSEPLVVFAVGIFADAVYYSVHAARLPWFSIGGAVASAGIVFVRSRLKTSPVG